MEAKIILSKCSKEKKLFGIRIQKIDSGDWVRTWAFPIVEKRAKCEGYDKETIKGSLMATERYPGCPYCKKKGFVRCGTCGKLTCWNKEKTLTCEWCGTLMQDITIAEQFELSSNNDL